VLAARGLREEDDGRKKRIATEFLVAVRRQASKVIVQSAAFAVVLTAAAYGLTLLLSR
jgi:hypothetical protein